VTSHKPVVAVIGTGLIGASVALALKENGYCSKVLGVGRTATSVENALKVGAIDEVLPDCASAAQADVIMLAAPVRAIISHLRELGLCDNRARLIMDAGSVKAPIVEAALESGLGGIFVGGHPMAGSEKSGAVHARADLFEKRTFFIVPTREASDKSLEEAERLVGALGAVPCRIGSKEHDKTVALVSHLPYLAAVTLSELAGNSIDSVHALKKGIAGGFRDVTRIADSSPEMWDDILSLNGANIEEWLDLLVGSAREIVAKARDNDNLEKLLADIREKRRKLLE